MKRGKPLVIGWSQLVRTIPHISELPGYHDINEISEKTGRSKTSLEKILRNLRETNKIDFKQAINNYGKAVWVYRE